MISIVVDRVGVHVSNAEDIDEHAQERCNEQQHHCNVIDVYANSEDLLIDGHTISTHPTKREPIANVDDRCICQLRRPSH